MTTTRLLVLVVLTGVAIGVALALQRRRPDPPSAPSYRAPAQLDHDDFGAPAGSWLIVLFGSTTCDGCPRAWDTVQSVVPAPGGAAPGAAWTAEGHAGPGSIVIRRVDVQDDPDTHKRYRIDGVPTTVIADPEGVVRQTFFGPMSSDQLVEALDGSGATRPPA